MLHSSAINELDGKHLPHSHLETLLKPMSNYSANCSCVNPFSFLFCFIKTPICFKFIIMSSSKIIIVLKQIPPLKSRILKNTGKIIFAFYLIHRIHI